LAQRLFEWREQEARRKDRPRNRILHDEQIMNLVKAPDRSWRDLKQAGFHNRTRQRIGDDVLALVDKTLAAAESDLPAPLDGKRVPVDKKQYKLLQAALGELAQTLKVPVEYAATRRDLEHIVRARSRDQVSLPVTFSGWREVHVGPALLNAC
jgi:ribonuclease D